MRPQDMEQYSSLNDELEKYLKRYPKNIKIGDFGAADFAHKRITEIRKELLRLES